MVETLTELHSCGTRFGEKRRSVASSNAVACHLILVDFCNYRDMHMRAPVCMTISRHSGAKGSAPVNKGVIFVQARSGSMRADYGIF
jgi:hypothetical protein